VSFITAVLVLATRAVRELLRTPARLLFPLVVPALLLLAYRVVLARLDELPGFGALTTVEFAAPGAIALSVIGAIGGAGFQMQQDLESGFFDRLRAAPIPRSAIVSALLLADALRYSLHAAVLLGLSLAAGARVVTGPAGCVVLCALAGVSGACWSGVGLNVALRTRNAETTAASTLFVLPLYFVSSALMPAALLPPWLAAFNAANPVAWLVEALRSLMTSGWEPLLLLRGVAGGALVAAITLPLAVGAFARTLEA
jgi:ABC-2 type transport system permease protein